MPLHLIYCNEWLTQNSIDSKSVLNGLKKSEITKKKRQPILSPFLLLSSYCPDPS
jgi:hypothetical protein